MIGHAGSRWRTAAPRGGRFELQELSPSQAAKLFHLTLEEISLLEGARAIIVDAVRGVVDRLFSRISMLPAGDVLLSGGRRGSPRGSGGLSVAESRLRRWLSLALRPWDPRIRESRLRRLIAFCVRKGVPGSYTLAIFSCVEHICLDVVRSVADGPERAEGMAAALRKRLTTEKLVWTCAHMRHVERQERAKRERLEQTIEARSQRLGSTVLLAQAVAEETDEVQVARALAKFILDTLDPDFLAVHVIDESDIVDTPVILEGGRRVDKPDDVAMRRLRNNWTLCRAARTGRAFEVADVPNALVSCPRQAWPCAEGSYCCVPLTNGTEVTGWMHLRRRSPEGFSHEEVEVLNIYGQMVGTALSSLRLMRQNRHQARTDPLTGLANRRHFEELLAREELLLARHEGQASLLMIDLDKFKEINDTYGHEAGDRMLRVLTAELRDCVRRTDEVARLGGDEFVILLRDCGVDDACCVAEKIIAALADKPVHMDPSTSCRMSVSIGVASCPEHGATLSDAWLLADAALYQAKDAGRGGFAIVDQSKPGFQKKAWRRSAVPITRPAAV